MESQFDDEYDAVWASADEDEMQEVAERLDETVGGEELNQNYDFKRSAIIYLLDARKEMFSPDNLIEDIIPFKQCLKCIRNAMRSKIWASKRLLCAFALLGTKKTDNPIKVNNIVIVQGLKMLSAEHIIKLDNISKSVDDLSFETEYGHEDFSLADAFWLCSKLFRDCGKMNLFKTVMLFTNDDNPTKNDRNELDRILSNTTNMVKNQIMFNLIHLGEKFNVDIIYKELIQLLRDDMDYQIPNPAITLQDMIDRNHKIDHGHVSFSSVPFRITNNFKCEVSIYYFTRKLKPPFKVKLSKATNEVVRTETQFFETETGKVVRKHKLVNSYKLGGKEIFFTLKELQDIEKLSEKGLRLFGFKPASSLNLEHFVKPCAFLYPSNPENAEKSSFFVALLTRCLERQVVPICTYATRKGFNVEYVALLPIEEEFASDKTQILPSGFLIFFLPCADDVRNLEDKCTGKQHAGKEVVELAKKLIKKLQFNYKPEMFPSPKLASHWSAIEALALNLKEPEPFVDSTLPPYKLIRSKTEKEANDLRDAIYTESYDPEGALPKKKAKPLKISKAAEMGIVVDADHVKNVLTSGEVHRLTIDMLKLFLQQVGQGTGLSKLKKSDLIEKACNYLKIPVP